jgi:glutamate-ammonia-ligase adenylyltransferase
MLDALRSHPEWIGWLSHREESPESTARSYDPAWNAYLQEIGTSGTILDALRAFKRREYLEISYRDISGLITFEQVVQRLSDLADWVIQRALDYCRKNLVEQMTTRDPETDSLEGFAVFALGKLGGRELNYSSDVDLVFCRRFSEEEADLRFYTRLGERLIQALSQSGSDGFLYRVDMRLRPHGESGPLVPTFESLVNYYESWGEAWERQALIKARHVAGSGDIGRRLEEFVTKFTFARQMDDSSLEEIKRVKHRAEREYAQGDGRIHLKQGPGGIRDIEFYVQYLQLISGWSHPEARSSASLKAIEGLGAARTLLEGEESQLSLAYMFLRTLEHRLQLRSLTPQALMPKERKELELLALGLGIREDSAEAAARRLEEILKTYRDRVRSILERVYLAPGNLRLTEREEEFARLLSERMPRERVREILAQYRFQDIDKAWQNIRLIALGPAGRLLPPGERRAFLEFVFPLLEVLRDSIDPDLALHRLEIFAAASGNRISFLRTLSSHRAHLQRLADLLALSALAHQILSRHPEYFDSLARGIHLHEGRRWDEMHEEVRERLGVSPRGEPPDAVLRKYRQREMVRIAYRDLAGLSTSLGISEELTALGHACVRAAWDLTRPSPEDLGWQLRDPLSVVAFGKLGSRQMHYSSDLDLVFLYDDPDADASPDLRARYQREQDARVERIVELLSGVTSDGVVYELDLRLRPEGASGLLARSWQSFTEYVLRSMEPWERMALIRSRILCSGSKNDEHWNSVVAEAVFHYPWDDRAFEELRHLKRRIETEKNKESLISIDFKYGKGGIVDLEFLVQWLQIHHGREHKTVRSPTIAVAVPELVLAGAISASQGEELLRTLRFQRNVENHYQLLEEWNSREISRESPVLERLALSLGYRGGSGVPARKAFLGDWDERARAVRDLLEAHVFA